MFYFYMFGIYFVRIKVFLSAWEMSIYVPTICVCMHCCWLGFLYVIGKKLSVAYSIVVAFARSWWTLLVQRCMLLTKVRKWSRSRPMVRLFWLLIGEKKRLHKYCLSISMDWQWFVVKVFSLLVILCDWLSFLVHIF